MKFFRRADVEEARSAIGNAKTRCSFERVLKLYVCTEELMILNVFLRRVYMCIWPVLVKLESLEYLHTLQVFFPRHDIKKLRLKDKKRRFETFNIQDQAGRLS